MFKNYFILNRLVVELNNQVKDFDITRAFSYEKDKIVFILKNKFDEFSFEISVNPGVPYLNLRRNFSIPKKNLVDFFSSYLPSKIIDLNISTNDRIIRINFKQASIYFTIRGKNTNLFLIDKNSEIETFKKTDEKVKNDFFEDVKKQNFTSDFNNLIIDEKFVNPESIRKIYPFIGKEIINEVKLRTEDSDNIPSSVLTETINEISINKPAVFIEENSNEVNLGIDSFRIFPFTKKEVFPNLVEAFNYFLIQNFSRENIFDKKKIIQKHLENELNKISGKLNDVQVRLERGSKEVEYNKTANLLLININNFSKGKGLIELPDIYDENNNISVKLDPKLSPKQNADSYFEKARNEKIKYERAIKLYSELKVRYSELININDKFINTQLPEDYNSIMKQLNIKTFESIKQGDELKTKFKHYLIQNKYHVYVGKDSKNNDLLTMKFAKQNDYWFHARGLSGSHVVLKNENIKEGIPKNILKAAASLAAFHSKAKTAGMAPVSYTQKKYVIKKKGMEPGKVALIKEEVLIVKPEIPLDCVFISGS